VSPDGEWDVMTHENIGESELDDQGLSLAEENLLDIPEPSGRRKRKHQRPMHLVDYVTAQPKKGSKKSSKN